MSRRTPDSPLPFTKACDLEADAITLQPYYDQLARYPDVLQGQHPIRQWEYAMALRAIDRWELQREREAIVGELIYRDPLEICDVGGAGSNFWKALTGLTSEDIIIVDPSLTELPADQVLGVKGTLIEAVEGNTPLVKPGRFDILTCISVIEHIPSDDLLDFFKAAHTLLKSGGLFFLTTDYWDAEGPDTAHFHWMRERIYNAGSMRNLTLRLRETGFRSFGGDGDWTYRGHQVYDYSVISLAMVKR